MKTCSRCGLRKAASDFLAGKARRQSSSCGSCRKVAASRRRRAYYAKIGADKRHTLAQRRRAQQVGTDHVEYSRTAIFARWGNRCAYCDAPAEHADHVHPLSRGGDDVEANILPACAKCNLTKSDKMLWEWALTFPGVAALE